MIHAKDINEQSKWQELTPGCEIYEPATASMTITGEWRTAVPVVCSASVPRTMRTKPTG